MIEEITQLGMVATSALWEAEAGEFYFEPSLGNLETWLDTV